MRNALVAPFLVVAVCAGLLSDYADAQTYPDRHITLVVPYAPGGISDVIARILSRPLQQSLGQPIVVENKPGAGGVLGIEALLRAPANGYTMLFADSQQWAITPLTFKNPSYQPQKDLAPINLVGTTEIFLGVGSQHGFRNAEDLFGRVRAAPGHFSYGSSGLASFSHLTMETLKARAGLDISHVPYRGGVAAINAMINSEIAMAFLTIGVYGEAVAQGKVKLLAVATDKRSPAAPEIPTLSELGIRDAELPAGFAFVAKSGTATEIIEKLHTAIHGVMNDPQIRERLQSLNFTPTSSTPKEAMDWIVRDLDRYKEAVGFAGLKPE